MNELTGSELYSLLGALAHRFEAAGASDVAALLRRPLPFFVGSMHEFFGEARDVLREVATRDPIALSMVESKNIAEMIERISLALRMDNLEPAAVQPTNQAKATSSTSRKMRPVVERRQLRPKSEATPANAPLSIAEVRTQLLNLSESLASAGAARASGIVHRLTTQGTLTDEEFLAATRSALVTVSSDKLVSAHLHAIKGILQAVEMGLR